MVLLDLSLAMYTLYSFFLYTREGEAGQTLNAGVLTTVTAVKLLPRVLILHIDLQLHYILCLVRNSLTSLIA